MCGGRKGGGGGVKKEKTGFWSLSFIKTLDISFVYIFFYDVILHWKGLPKKLSVSDNSESESPWSEPRSLFPSDQSEPPWLSFSVELFFEPKLVGPDDFELISLSSEGFLLSIPALWMFFLTFFRFLCFSAFSPSVRFLFDPGDLIDSYSRLWVRFLPAVEFLLLVLRFVFLFWERFLRLPLVFRVQK